MRTRSIPICERWLADFQAFSSDVGDPPRGLSLQRVDRARPLGPDNWEWGHPRKFSGHRFETVNGETLSHTEWARRLGMSRERIRQYVSEYGSLAVEVKRRAKQFNVSIEEVIADFRRYQVHKPQNSLLRIETIAGTRLTRETWARRLGISRTSLRNYLRDHGTLAAEIKRRAKYFGVSLDKVIAKFRRYKVSRSQTSPRKVLEQLETIAGTTLRRDEWARQLGISEASIRNYVRNHGSLKAEIGRRAKQCDVPMQAVVVDFQRYRFHASKHAWQSAAGGIHTLETIAGKTMSRKEWARRLGIRPESVKNYVRDHGSLKAEIERRAKRFRVTMKAVINDFRGYRIFRGKDAG